jgi:hypothetical protein
VTTFGLVYTDIYPDLPFGTSGISATSKVSTTDFTGWIASAGAEMAGVLTKAGIGLDHTTMDADVLAQVRSAVRAYCVWQALLKLGQSAALMTSKRAEWERLVQQYRDRPALLNGQGSEYRSNINVEPRRARRFGADHKW